MTIVDPGQPLGSHVYVLRGRDGDNAHLVWDAMIHTTDLSARLVELGALHRIQLPPDMTAAVHARWHPGMMLVVNDLLSHPDTRTGSDFVVISDDTVA